MLSRAEPPKSRVLLATGGRILSAASPPEEAAAALRVEVAEYLFDKFPSAPRDLLVRESFETDDGSLALETATSDAGKVWGVRFSEPDTTAPGRYWTVEFTVGSDRANVFVGARLSCFSRGGDFDVDPKPPRLLTQFVKKHRLVPKYGFAFSSSPLPVETDEDVDRLLRLLNHESRWASVAVISLDEDGRALINPDFVAENAAGIGHVYTLSPEAAETLSVLVGRERSVFNRGVRLYRPGYDEDDPPSRHPVIVRRRLESLDTYQLRSLERWFRGEMFKASIERSDIGQDVPSFGAIRSAATVGRLALLQSRGASIEDQLQAQEQARKAAEAESSSAWALALQEEEFRREAEDDRDAHRAQAMALVARVEALESKLQVLGSELEIGSKPASFNEVAAWAEANFAGKLVLTPRAIRGLKDAEYESVSIVCDALRILATHYRDLLLGRLTKENFDTLVAQAGLSMSGSIAVSRAGEFGDEYFVQYGGRRNFLHGHLQKGNSHEARYCMRIYFFWDQAESAIVVGWLPSHLTNRFS